MLCEHAEVKFKLLNTSSCVAIFILRRLELFENLEKVDSSFLNLKVKEKVSFLLYGSQSATSKSSNHEILKFVYIKETVRFDTLLFCPKQ